MKRVLLFYVISVGMVLSSGCAVTRNELMGESYASFKTTSARGDATRIYVQGRYIPNEGRYVSIYRPYTAYMVIDLKDGEVVSRSLPKRGEFPPEAFECSEIPQLWEVRLINFHEITNRKIFIQSGLDSAFGTDIGGVFYFRNPDDINNPVEVYIPYRQPTPQDETLGDTMLYYAAYPLVLTGAVVFDIITFPFQLLLGCAYGFGSL